jgi:phosphoesterase RecJ-like protein
VDLRAAIAQTLRDSTHTLIVCHVAPDGDCLGAGLALAAALGRVQKPATVASTDGVPPSLAFLPGVDRVITELPEGEPAPVVVTIECPSPDRTGRFAPALGTARTVIAIDHHEDHVPYANLTDWDPSAAAVGEQVAEVIERLGVEIDRPIALSLLTAVVTDTGVFRYTNTTPHTLRLAADLMERGATVHEIVRMVYEEQRASTLRLQGHVLSGLQLHCGGAVAVGLVTRDMLAESRAGPEETSGIAAILRTLAGVRLALLFEERDETVRVSIRSRDGARADRVARALGGGGHPAAAGAEVAGDVGQVLERALGLAVHELKEAQRDS